MSADPGGPAQAFIARLTDDDLERFMREARRLASRYGLEVSEADDILQEALLRLWTGNRLIDSEAGFRAYLAAAVRSIAFDALRRRRNETRHGRVAVSAAEVGQVPADAAPDNRGDVPRLLAILTDRERQVATLTLQGLSAVDIAKALAIDSATVRSLLRRVRARFALMTDPEP